MSEAPDPRTFFAEVLPSQFNGSLAKQVTAAETAQRALDGMRAVDATLRFQVRGDDGGTFFVNLEQGRASAA